jgi:hypothetical protein
MIQWKGATFQQISAGIKYNNPSTPNLFAANPVKGYRREIASVPLDRCNPRTSTRIDDFLVPNSVITTPTISDTGLANTLDFSYENNSCQHDCQPTFLSAADNARRRVRSSGNIRKDDYYTNSRQYLTSRNRSYEQNQYFHVKYGNTNVKPGSALSVNNIYQSNGSNHCELYKVTANTSFQYKWLDGIMYVVNVPVGQYNIDTFNSVLQRAMDKNYHYYVSIPDNSHIYLLSFTYDTVSNKVSINSIANTLATFPTSQYAVPLILADITWNTITNIAPQILITEPIVSRGLGFGVGTLYPVVNTSNQTAIGQNIAGITPSYVPIYYKPNNPQFGVQGAVSSADLITRKKYDAITNVGSSFRSAYGDQTANAVAYGSSMYGYTIKDKIGYPTKKTPTFSKYSSEMKQCSMRKLANAI